MSVQKEKFELEYILKTSPAILFSRLSTPSGLSEWFADDVNLEGKIFRFVWDGSEQQAEQVLKKENKMGFLSIYFFIKIHFFNKKKHHRLQ